MASMNLPDQWHLVPIATRSKNPGSLLGKGWQHQASNDAAIIAAWRNSHFGCNWGLLLGPKSGVIDVEYDTPEGQAIIDDAVAACDVRTVSYRSAKSVHRLFVYEDRFIDQKASVGVSGTEWRFGQNSAQSVIPDSIHEDGVRYEWLPGLSPDEVEIAPLPDAMWNLFLDLQHADQPEKIVPPTPPRSVTEGDSLVDCARNYAEQNFEWDTLLRLHGWSFCRTRGEALDWWRPGKSSGSISGTVNFDGSGTLRVFSSNAAPLENESSYDKFAFICALECGDDPVQAANHVLPEDIREQRKQTWIEQRESEQPDVDLTEILSQLLALSEEVTQAEIPSMVTVEELEQLAAQEPPTESFTSRQQTDLPDECFSMAPELLRNCIDYMLSEAMYPQPEASLAASLCLVATLTGRKVEDPRGTRTNLYCVTLGKSGRGKEWPRKASKQILNKIAPDLLGEEGFASSSGMLRSLEENPCQLFQIDEFGSWLSGITGANSPPHMQSMIRELNTLYTSADDQHWKSTAYADRRNNITICQPHAVVHGSSVAEEVWDNVTPSLVRGGLMGRCLFFECLGKKKYHSGEGESAPQSLLDDLMEMGQLSYGPGNLSQLSPTPRRYQRSPEAEERFVGHIMNVDEKLEQESGVEESIWARVGEKTAKMCLLSAVARKSETIEIQDVEWAILLINALTRRVIQRISGNVADGWYGHNLNRIHSVIKEHGALIRRELTRKTQGGFKVKDRNEILDNLIEGGQIKSIRVSRGKRAGQWFGLSYRHILQAVRNSPAVK